MSVDALRQSSQAHKRALDNQEKRQKLELEMAQKNADANLNEMRKSKAQDAINIDSEHHKQVAEKTFEKEKKLEKLRLHMDETQKLTDRELQRQQELHKKTLADKNENFQRNFSETREKQEMAFEDNNHKFNIAARNAADEQNNQVMLRENRFQNQDVQQKELWNNKINQNRNQFSETYQAESAKFDHLKSKQEAGFKKNLAANHQKNETKLSEQQKLHVKQEERLKQQNNKAIQDKEVFFEKKYQDQLGRHVVAEKNLEETNKKVVERSKEDLVKRVKVYESRSSDPFFTFTHIKPTVTEQPDHYVLKMPIPEYAKEEVILSTNNREIVLTFNRRHKEERVDEDGSKLKVDKVESTVSRIPVEQILNPRKTTKEWADGVMTYKVFKA